MIIFLSFIMSEKNPIDVIKTFISSTEPSTKENQLNVRTISSLKRANEPPLNVSSVSMRVNPMLKEMWYQIRAARFGELNLSLSPSLSLSLSYLKLFSSSAVITTLITLSLSLSLSLYYLKH